MRVLCKEDPGLRDQFGHWINKGNSLRRAATLLNRAERDILGYLNGHFTGDIIGLEKDIAALLQREDDAVFPIENTRFCKTSVAREIWTALLCCDRDGDMGVIVGPAGCGKTETIKEYKRRHRDTILITANVTTRIGPLLYSITKILASTTPTKANAIFFDSIVRALIKRPRFLVIDEGHHLNWKELEALRAIYDATGVGVAISGQPEIFERILSGNTWSQLLSRVGVRCYLRDVDEEDARLVCNGIYPGLDERCLAFLSEKAQGTGGLRVAVKLLQRGIQVHEKKGVPLSIGLLKEIAGVFLL